MGKWRDSGWKLFYVSSITVAACLCAALLFWTKPLQRMELVVSDYHFRLRGQKTFDDRLSMILVDMHTVRKLGVPPFSRRYYAIVTSALVDAGAKEVALDYIFEEERPQDNMGNQMLVKVISLNEDVILGWNASELCTPAISSVSPGIKVPSAIDIKLSPESALYNTSGTISLPYPSLLDASDSLGIISVVSDVDGAIRRIPLLVQHAGQIYPSFSLLIACRALDVSPVVAKPGEYLLLRGERKEIRIPIDSMGQMVVNYTGDMMSFANARSSFYDVYESIISGKYISPVSVYKDKIVIIGRSDLLSSDIFPMPFDNLFPGVAIQAMAVNTILQGHFLNEAPVMLNMAVLVFFTVAAALVNAFRRPWVSAVAAGILVIVLWFVSHIFFISGGMMLGFMQPATGVILAFSGMFLYNYTRERPEKLRLEKELEDARQRQTSLLPRSDPQLEGFDIAGFCRPAREVGGDFYDYLSLGDGRTGIALVDVSGKGLKGAMNAVLVDGMLSEVVKNKESCSEVLSALNVGLCPRMDDGMYVVFGLVILDQKAETLQWARAGLEYPIVRQGTQIFQLQDGECPLGLFPDSEYPDVELKLQTGDFVVFYTDGITDAMNKRKEAYNFLRLGNVIKRIDLKENARTIIQTILQDVANFVGSAKQFDDMTIVVVKKL